MQQECRTSLRLSQGFHDGFYLQRRECPLVWAVAQVIQLLPERFAAVDPSDQFAVGTRARQFRAVKQGQLHAAVRADLKFCLLHVVLSICRKGSKKYLEILIFWEIISRL